MADWRIVTPTRAPRDDELGPLEGVSGASSTRAIVFAARVFKSAKCSISYISVESTLSVTISEENLYYNLDSGVWSLSRGGEGVNIAEYDMTIPENEVNSAETYPYFSIISFEKGTTACKLAVTNEAKTLIRNALINKGVDVPDTTPFRQYAGKVGEIQTGDLPKSIKVTIYNSIRAEYDVHYFSSVSGQGPQVIHLSKESDVTFSILSDTPISIEGPQNPEPIIRDVLHSIDAVCLTTSAPGTGENYFSFSTNELFDPGKGVISLEVIDQYG